MKNKTTLMLGGAFLVLVLIFLITSYNPPEETKGATALFPSEKPLIDKFEIKRANGESIVLEKKNSLWYITSPFEYKASDVAIEQTITGLLNIQIDGVVSNRKEAQEKFGVSDSTGISLKAYSNGKSVLDVIAGKNTVDLTHTYVRMANSSDISLWRGLFARQIDKEIDDWRDKTIYSFNPGDILTVSIKQGSIIREAVLQDTTWVYKENGKEKPVDQAKIKQSVNFIATMNCDTFAEGPDIPRAAEKAADTQVTFTVRNGDKHTYDVWTPGENDNGRYLVRKENGDILFRFYRFRGSRIILNYEDIKSI
ncbi:DUF4340 domain-containing protein [bacterium]|nr:DUF4340 domain-containing protein [bacterium]